MSFKQALKIATLDILFFLSCTLALFFVGLLLHLGNIKYAYAGGILGALIGAVIIGEKYLQKKPIIFFIALSLTGATIGFIGSKLLVLQDEKQTIFILLVSIVAALGSKILKLFPLP